MKTTLTKNDPIGWYLSQCSQEDTDLVPIYWDGEKQWLFIHGNGSGSCPAGSYATNFQPLIQPPAEYLTIYERAEQFLSEFARNPVSDTIEIFSKHLREHVAQLAAQKQKLGFQVDDLNAAVLRGEAEIKFYETQASETVALATSLGWVPGSPLAAFLKQELESKPAAVPSDPHIGTQDTADNHWPIGDGDDTWEAWGDEAWELTDLAKSELDEAILKRVPDSPGEWHHCSGLEILNVWESKQGGVPCLKGQYINEKRNHTSAGEPIGNFRTTIPSWVKAEPPIDANCEAMKTLRELTTAVNEACDEAEIPNLRTKMASAHLPEPMTIRERVKALTEKLRLDTDDRTIFCCPECGGTYFGTTGVTKPKSQWIRDCHDQYGIGCKWSGKDKDCIVKGEVAARRLSNAVAKRQGLLTAIGNIVKPAGKATLLEAVQATVDDAVVVLKRNVALRAEHGRAHDFRRLVFRAAGCPESKNVIEYIENMAKDLATALQDKRCHDAFRKEVLEAAKPENPADVVTVIKALRAQRDQLRVDLQKNVAANHEWSRRWEEELAKHREALNRFPSETVQECRNRFFRWIDNHRPWAHCSQWTTNVFPVMNTLADQAAIAFAGCTQEPAVMTHEWKRRLERDAALHRGFHHSATPRHAQPLAA